MRVTIRKDVRQDGFVSRDIIHISLRRVSAGCYRLGYTRMAGERLLKVAVYGRKQENTNRKEHSR